ncbi:hypothetical protein CEXT_518121 [Caerostris extrusa]|uniref:Uncharacterized protein n=1 Tax=Caerostris extrusa TaxID=172846 RepID=A0AAV4SM05_CAEEX|nr:hypothetical protein CEXT_518121 [Caerostris extrusa]
MKCSPGSNSNTVGSDENIIFSCRSGGKRSKHFVPRYFKLGSNTPTRAPRTRRGPITFDLDTLVYADVSGINYIGMVTSC